MGVLPKTTLHRGASSAEPGLSRAPSAPHPLPGFPWDAPAVCRPRPSASRRHRRPSPVGTPVDPTPELLHAPAASVIYWLRQRSARRRCARRCAGGSRCRRGAGAAPRGASAIGEESRRLAADPARSGAGDLVGIPAVAYPTYYDVGARLVWPPGRRRPRRPADPSRGRSRPCSGSTSPSNPTGRGRSARAAARAVNAERARSPRGRRRGGRDSHYAEAGLAASCRHAPRGPSSRRRASSASAGLRGSHEGHARGLPVEQAVLLAGYRAAFRRRRREHLSGTAPRGPASTPMMVPGPVRGGPHGGAGMTTRVADQRERRIGAGEILLPAPAHARVWRADRSRGPASPLGHPDGRRL